MTKLQELAQRNKAILGRNGRNLLHLNLLFHNMAEQSLIFFAITSIPIVLGSFSSQIAGADLSLAVIQNSAWSAIAIIGNLASERALESHLNVSADFLETFNFDK